MRSPPVMLLAKSVPLAPAQVTDASFCDGHVASLAPHCADTESQPMRCSSDLGHAGAIAPGELLPTMSASSLEEST